mmetsp:Transcript_113154/g.205803  ORF Transcript_113154/g.205803 Transcript_113154/m.205803 type:complete len:252 (+) Transcript_113154:3382-4137(+)
MNTEPAPRKGTNGVSTSARCHPWMKHIIYPETMAARAITADPSLSPNAADIVEIFDDILAGNDEGSDMSCQPMSWCMTASKYATRTFLMTRSSKARMPKACMNEVAPIPRPTQHMSLTMSFTTSSISSMSGLPTPSKTSPKRMHTNGLHTPAASAPRMPIESSSMSLASANANIFINDPGCSLGLPSTSPVTWLFRESCWLPLGVETLPSLGVTTGVASPSSSIRASECKKVVTRACHLKLLCHGTLHIWT